MPTPKARFNIFDPLPNLTEVPDDQMVLAGASKLIAAHVENVAARNDMTAADTAAVLGAITAVCITQTPPHERVAAFLAVNKALSDPKLIDHVAMADYSEDGWSTLLEVPAIN